MFTFSQFLPLTYDIDYYTQEWSCCNVKLPILPRAVLITQIIPDSRDTSAYLLEQHTRNKINYCSFKCKSCEIQFTFARN